MKRYLMIFAIMIACSSNQDNSNNKALEFYESLPQMEFPLKFNSKYDPKIKTIELENDSIISKLIPEEYAFSIFGKLYRTENYFVIIGYIPDDYASPIIISFDNNLKKIDSFDVYQTTGFDIGYYCSNYAMIKKNREIEFIDSTLTRQLNEDGSDEIPGTDSIRVRKKFFMIDENGFFVEKK